MLMAEVNFTVNYGFSIKQSFRLRSNQIEFRNIGTYTSINQFGVGSTYTMFKIQVWRPDYKLLIFLQEVDSKQKISWLPNLRK